MIDVQTTIVYRGDSELIKLLQNLGLGTPLAEIKARLMKNVWASTPQFPTEIIVEIVGTEKYASLNEVDKEDFRNQILGLWKELSKHRDPKYPFHFTQFPKAKEAQDIVERIKCRVVEVRALMPVLLGDFRDEAASTVASLKSAVSGSCEHLNAVLEHLASSETIALDEVENLLATIDSNLETAFNGLSVLLAKKPPAPLTFMSDKPGKA
jgi:hypothetical protein